MSYKPATADDYLLELDDDELIEVTGNAPASRVAAKTALGSATKAAFGVAPTEDALTRVVETLIKYDLIAPADETAAAA